MNRARALSKIAAPLWAALLCASFAAEVAIQTGHAPGDVAFKLDPVPPPAIDDAATGATFKIIGGTADPNARGGLAVLHDGGYTEIEILRWLFLADDSLPGRPVDALHGDLAREVIRRAQAMAF